MNDSLEKWLRPYSKAMREMALESDVQGSPSERFVKDPFFKCLHNINTPPEYWEGIKLDNGEITYGMLSIELVMLAEHLSYGDPALYLAMPGPNLAGTIVNKLGTREQRDQFFGYYAKNTAWSAFALTEPSTGSDASSIAMEAKKINDAYVISGTKRYIGNGGVADWSVVFAKTSKELPSGLGIEAFLLPAGDPLIKQTIDETLGMKAARLGIIEIDQLVVDATNILGHDRKPLKRGLRSALELFNHMRPTTSAIALGLCRAVLDYMTTNFRLNENQKIRINHFNWELKRGRLLIHKAAHQADSKVFSSPYSAMSKRYFNLLVSKITRECLQMISTEELLDHPLIEKWLRDASMIEFMEGTTNILTLEVTNKIVMGR
ncbi:acyl-CoA dehydrogenase family protein [Priestia koreensis]|uniref:acyl-CoA dehydrogenase family protein n=1 Tax=Priestia koreensis TaxID=284581 RepID=UPI003CFD1804